MGVCVCECVFKRVNVLGVLESVASRAVKRCPAPATSVTRDPVTPVLFSALQAPQISLHWNSPSDDRHLLSSLFLHTSPVAFDLPSTSASPRDLPSHSSKGAETRASGELIAGPWNQELSDTKKQREERKLREEKGERGGRWLVQDRSGTGSVRLLAGALRGVKLHQRKRGGRGRRNCWHL